MKEEVKQDIIERNEYIIEMQKEGLTVAACEKLYKNKKKRDRAIERNEGDTTALQRGYNNWVIRECDKNEKKIKAEDWKENNPKQYAVYYIGEVSKMCDEMDAETDEVKKEAIRKKINDFQDENDEWRKNNIEVYEEVKAQIFSGGEPKEKDKNKDIKEQKDDDRKDFSVPLEKNKSNEQTTGKTDMSDKVVKANNINTR